MGVVGKRFGTLILRYCRLKACKRTVTSLCELSLSTLKIREYLDFFRKVSQLLASLVLLAKSFEESLMSQIRYCSKCHCIEITQQPLCPKCSHQLITFEEYTSYVSNAKKQEAKDSLIWAIFLFVTGVVCILWSCVNPELTWHRRFSGREFSPGALGLVFAGIGFVWLICIGFSRSLKHPDESGEGHYSQHLPNRSPDSEPTNSPPKTGESGMLPDEERQHCRVCGLKQQTPPWSKDGQPSFDICLCCGAEFGCDDVKAIDILHRRKDWLASGAVWRDPSSQPQGWSLMAQLEEIPSKYQLKGM